MDNALLARYEARQSLLDRLRDSLESETKAALNGVEHVDRVSFRVKTGKSFVEKAADPGTTPPYREPLLEIEDQVAGRVIVFFLDDIRIVLDRLRGTFNAVERTHKRPKKDEEFGYESAHLICNIPPHMRPDGWAERDDLPGTFELQVRTIFMHAYAEPQHNIGYKASSELPSQIRKELAWIAASAWGADQAYERVRSWSASKKAAPKG